MMIRLQMTIASLMLCLVLNGQREADWTCQFDSKTEDFFFHQSTGVPIVATAESYYGIDPANQKPLWEVGRAGIQKAGAIINVPTDYHEVPLSQLAFMSSALVDVATGRVVINGAEMGINNFLDYYFLPEQRYLLVEASGGGEVKLMAIDMQTYEMTWATVIDNSSLGEKLGGSNIGAKLEKFIPSVIGNGTLIYKSDKESIVLNFKTGEVLWRAKTKPVDYKYNEATNQLIVIEKSGGMNSQSNKPGKIIYILDADTGESSWKKDIKLDENIRHYDIWDNDKLLVIHADGMNFYSLADGKTIWKKDFSEKRINGVQRLPEGLEVYYKGNRKMLISEADGKKIWKKEIKLEIEASEDIDLDNILRTSTASIVPDASSVVIHYLKDDKYRQVECRAFAIDDDADKLVALSIDKDKVTIVDLIKRSGKTDIKVKIKAKHELTRVSVIPGVGYFIYGDNDFALINVKGEITSEKSYKIPGETGRRLGNAAMTLGAAAAGTAYLAGGLKAGAGTVGSLFSDSPKFAQMVSSGTSTMEVSSYANDVLSSAQIDRFKGFQEQDGHVFFFSKNDDGDKILYRVDKATGEEIDKLLFYNNRPAYSIDKVSNIIYYIHEDKLHAFSD